MTNTGDRVRIHYTGRLEDGDTFDSSIGREPFEFVVGSQQVISGLDRAVLDMDAGEAHTVTVPPSEGYGEYQEGLARAVPRDRLPEGVHCKSEVLWKAGQHPQVDVVRAGPAACEREGAEF